MTGGAIFFSSCGGGSASSESSSEAEATTEAVAADPVTYEIDIETTEVAWKGEVAGVYGHNGVIDVKEGSITAEGEKVTGGSIVIDMTTIQPLDTASYEASGKTPQDLVDHLTTGDFFLVEEFPTASFTIKSHEGNTITGDLTIRGTTNEETIELSSLEAGDGGFSAVGKLVFDRQKYGVSWEHYIKDYVLSDDITLDISVAAK